MTTTIDERIVSMGFENQVFEQRAAQTMATLGKLNAAINGMDSAKGLEDIEKSGSKVTLKGPMAALDKLKEKLGRSGDGAAQGFSDIEKASSKVTLEGTGRAIDKTQQKLEHLSAGSTFSDLEKASTQVQLAGISKAIETVSGKFSLLQNAASVAIGGITATAATKGLTWVKSFGIGPITDGLHEYETNLKAIQTVQANTDQPLTKINASLAELNTYSDQTIYNFSEMARNVGTFTAAGVDLKTSVSSIKGIANMAALSGSTSEQAAGAMYQLSQAISSGKVGLQDWNSVVNAGMGGKKLQNALAQTAIAMGGISGSAVKLEGPMKKLTIDGQSFRDSISGDKGSGWLSSDVLVNTLATLDGRFSKAALSAALTKDGIKKYTAAQIEAKIADSRASLEKKNGVKYTDAQFKSLMKLSDSAFKSATEVKTLGQVFDVAKETIGSGWSASFQSIFGNLTEAKKTFTALSTTINGFINASALARNNVLHDWKELGGRTALIDGIKQAFTNVLLILKPIQSAFRDIFPPKTGKDLFNMTKGFHELMIDLRPSPAVIGSIHSAFKIFFNVLDIGWNIVKGVAGVLADLLGVVSKGQGGFATFIGGISKFVDSAHDALIEGGLLQTFFDGLGDILKKPVSWLIKLGHLLAGLFTSGGEKAGGAALDGVDKLNEKLPPLEKIINGVKNAWAKLVGWFGQAKAALEPWLSSFVDKMASLGDTIKNALSGIKFDDVLKGAQTGIMAGFLVMFRDLFGKGGGMMDEVSKTMGSVQNILGGVSENLEAMQKKVQAETILAIAGAVIALAGGVFILSTIDGPKLAKAMAAVAVGLGELMGAMKLMTAGLGVFGALKLPIIAAGLIGLSIAVTILAAAMKIFGTMSWEEIGKGLTGVAGALGAIAAGMQFMPKGPTMVAQAAGILILGVALNAIASALKVMGGMKWEDLAKGLYGMITALGTLALTMGMMPPNMLVNAAAIVVLSFALLTLSGAIRSMGSMDLGTLVKGIGGVMVALAALGVAMLPWAILGPALIPAAAGLFVVSGALVILGKALEIIGGIGIVNLVKGLAAIGVALVELAVGMYLMIGTLPGAVAMMAAAAALAVLAPTLGLLGNMSWGTIFKGLAAIALVLGTIAVVGLIAAPALAALGIALIPLGLGFMLVAGAAKIFASALALLGDQGQKGISVFLVALTGFVAILPTIIISFIKGLVSIAEEVAKVAPKVIAALAVVLQQIIQFVSDNAAKLATAVGLLVDAIVTILVENVPKLVAAGISLLMGLLNGISQNISQVTNKVSEIIVKFLSALTSKMPALVTAGANALKAFLDGVSSRFGEIAGAVGTLIARFATAVGTQASKITSAAASMMGHFVGALATFGPQLLMAGANVILQVLEGVAQQGPNLIKRGVGVARQLMDGLAQGLVSLADNAVKALIAFMNGIEAAIRNNTDPLIDAGAGIGDAIMDGIIKGFGRGGALVRKALEQVFNLLPNWAKKVLGIHSPSKVFHEIGAFTMLGYQKGISDSSAKTKKTMEDAGKNTGKGFTDGLGKAAPEMMAKATQLPTQFALLWRSALGIHSPSKLFAEIGAYTMTGFILGVGDSSKDIRDAMLANGGTAMSGMADGISASQGAPVDAAMAAGGAMIGAINTAITAKVGKIPEVFRDLGISVRGAFKDSLAGSADDVVSGFDSLNSSLIDKIRDLRGQVKDGTGQLEDLYQQHADKVAEIGKLRSEKKPDTDAIASAVKESEDLEKQIRAETIAVGQNGKALTAARDVRKTVTVGLKDEETQLVAMKKGYEDLNTQLEDATTKLNDLTQKRNDIQQKFAAKPDVSNLVDNALSDAALTDAERADKVRQAEADAAKKAKIDQVALYEEALKEQLVATIKYQATLKQLQDLGLDNETYQKLLDEGLAGQDFADQLVKSGKKGVDKINELDAQILAKSTDLANQATEKLYGMGVAVAQGLVDGINAKKADLEKQMNDLADVMVNAIKNKLKIKSPSRIFMELGAFTAEGLAQGLRNSSQSVTGAAQALGDDAKAALSSSLSHILDTVGGEIDPTLTITPVLDLTQIRKDAAGITDLSNVIPISAATSFGQASATSQEVSASQQAAQEAAAAAATSVSLTQNNYSPEALNAVEIYRQTRNQVGQLKSALGIPVTAA